MAATIITPEDLQNFKQEMLEEIRNILSQKQTAPARKWLKSNEVRRLLLVSPGTLQNLRITGKLPPDWRGSSFRALLKRKSNLSFRSFYKLYLQQSLLSSYIIASTAE
jgi:hypothetical protein